MTHKHLSTALVIGGTVILFLNKDEKKLTPTQIKEGDNVTMNSIGKLAILVGVSMMIYNLIKK